MRLSSFTCNHCGSSNLRRSRRHSTLDALRMLFGNYRLRCLDCDHRFSANLLLSKAVVAKCPRCLNIKLATWDPQHYRIPGWKKFLIALGGHRYRCNSCRYNFVSFRPSGTFRKQ
jgi:hypothetical protein